MATTATKANISFFIINLVLFYVSNFNQIFANLHGIQSSTLTDLVAREPESQAVFVAEVFAYATHVNVVFTGGLEGQG